MIMEKMIMVDPAFSDTARHYRGLLWSDPPLVRQDIFLDDHGLTVNDHGLAPSDDDHGCFPTMITIPPLTDSMIICPSLTVTHDHLGGPRGR